MKKIDKLLIYRIVFAVIGWIGLFGHFIFKVMNRGAGTSVGGALLDSVSHYTIQTNILVLVWFTIAIVARLTNRDFKILSSFYKGAITLYISFTFVIYAVLLSGLWAPEGIEALLAFISHYITPVAFMIDWVFYEFKGHKEDRYEWRNVVKWLVYPLVYLGYLLIYGGMTGRYFYPFLYVPKIGWDGLVVSVVVLCGCYIVAGGVYIAVGRVIGKRVDK
ncbi:Pr6Pr family membrane protein [Vallitalea guaymasensis]|uniref:Pr6Pr family membrane protein n=1 Tax=Vallitalea guaymasensis TaxID=1185412 RepID=A0A8J8SBH0_9FIRM|nr:Pr6Pr family membrane protein [Vallitalea guaymasensis]QUH28659.1 Pr6Pr family membrane protein [Vallitalea guaymasensis]